MSTTTVDFGSQRLAAVGIQRVYLRQKWQDSWELYPDLHCLEATWCLSPSMPTATLQWDYGFTTGLSSLYYARAAKLDVNGWYAKVMMQTDVIADTWNTWYGVVNQIEDEHQGIVTVGGIPLATGRQTLHCYGLEKLLDTEYLSESWVDNGDEQAICVQLPIEFNARGKPNMNDREAQPYAGHVFEGQVLTPGGTNRPTAAWWSTVDICDYLAKWAVPRESFRTRNKRIPFAMVGHAFYLSPADQPTLEQEGQTVLSLLNRLIDRRRLRSFYMTVDETKTPNEVQIVVVPWNKDVINFGIAGTYNYLGNANLLRLKYDKNENTSTVLRKTKVNRYDRVVVRGARRTSTATFHVAAAYLAAAWTTAEETAYEAGASGVTGYATWDDLQQQQRNAEVRSADELSAVYSWFKLPDTWNLQIEAATGSSVNPVFVDSAGNSVPQCIHEVVWEPQLPFYEHVDYSGDAIENGADEPPILVYRQPLVWFKIPDTTRYIAGDAVGTLAEGSADQTDDGGNSRWSARVQTQTDTRTLEVHADGEKQHVIAGANFTALTEDRDLGDFTYSSKGMLITATLRDNRYAEGKYPADGSRDGTLIDQQFGYVIYAGDSYRQDYVVPGTVVDVDSAGALVVSNGGYVRDDTDMLAVFARIAYEWWSQERTILSFSTTQLTSLIQVGYLIETIGDSTIVANIPGVGEVVNEHYEVVNTVVSELRITWPRLDGNQLAAPRMEFTTGAGELDPMTLAPPRSKARSRRQAAVEKHA